MPNPTVTAHFGAPSVSDAPLDVGDLVTLLNTLALPIEVGGYAAYVTGASQPPVNDQDKIWFKVDASGAPVAVKKFFNGNWRNMPTGNQGEIAMFAGDPSFFFDTTGKAFIGNDQWDGWALCNGKNNTVNLTDKFIVSAHMDNSDAVAGYDNGWQTNVSGGPTQSGGAKEFTSNGENTYRPARDAVLVDHWHADGNTPEPSANLWGKHAVSGSGSEVELLPEDKGQLDPDPIPILPPYIAFGFVQWVGY
jgi:hypothetical protein